MSFCIRNCDFNPHFTFYTCNINIDPVVSHRDTDTSAHGKVYSTYLFRKGLHVCFIPVNNCYNALNSLCQCIYIM